MEELTSALETAMKEHLQMVVLCKNLTKDSSPKPFTKSRIRPIATSDRVSYQAEEQRGTQAFHVNLAEEEVSAYIAHLFGSSFGQLFIKTDFSEYTCLANGKGKITIKRHVLSKASAPSPVKIAPHNRPKQYIITEGTPVPFLIDLGVMTKKGTIVQSRYDKFRQINRFLEYIRDILPALPKDRELTMIDFGCGKSYLTFAVYYYLHELEGFDVRIIGLDLKEDVIAHCSKLSRTYGYEKLSFLCGDIAHFEGVDHVDLVMTLHACDTATDYALAKAVKWGASCILSVPCCQHELNRQMDHPYMDTVLSYGILKERAAALMTDGIRGQVLEAYGYKTQLLEFIDMAHTPKNILIRAVYHGKKADSEKITALKQMIDEFHIRPTLTELLPLDWESVSVRKEQQTI